MSTVGQNLGIDDTFGAAFIGVLISTMLYGLTSLQTYFYYTYYPKDRIENKILVAAIWALDTAHTALAARCMYYYLISNFSNPPALVFGHWSLFVSVVVNDIIALLVHIFFTLRIFQLCGPKFRWYLTFFISVLILAHFAFGIETVVFLFIKKELSKLSEITLFAAMPFALFAVLSDIVIAGSLVILLWGSRTGFRRTKNLVNALIVYAINRCILTSVVAVAEVIAFAVSPHSLWFLGIDFVVGKLYANSLLATLNSRKSLRTGDTTINSVHMSNINFGDHSDSVDIRQEAQKGVVLDLRQGNTRSGGSRTTHHSTFIEPESKQRIETP